ncbi:hypothetical protein A6V39_05370 [Candidatus Mycoplasma haematobovis]|uniref:Uncharacterized protein n=1 Tax=Candidatus Mycoplasma haematobovis TaxID=432608 RepID=A0A1A9QCT1_9MOLU|nr:hypothetical protein [Candidatus Mycoplasma haematobovis]OAL09765.1 hypothetical protein A6V39_05370 [Candidatus Mycoplasma haematobovis]
MSIKNFLSALIFVGVAGLIALEAYTNLFKKPFLKVVLETQGFKALFEIKKDPFNKWKRTFVTNKKDIIKENFVPYLTSKASNDEGAYYLNRWCREVFNSSSWDSVTLWRARRYCTATLGVEFLEEDNVSLVEELDPSVRDREWNRVFKELKSSIAQSGIIGEFSTKDIFASSNIELLKDWCSSKLNQSPVNVKPKERRYARSWCVTLDTPKLHAV